MFSNIVGGIMMCIPAAITTFMSIRWWMYFGVDRPYPYILTLMAALLWAIAYVSFKEEE